MTAAGWSATYSRADWQIDRSVVRAPCPRCGHDEDYGPRDDADTALPGNVRHYRACKVCGQFQEADGMSAPYETVITVHHCLGKIGAGVKCGGCGNVMAGRPWHLGPRIIRAGDTFTCPECHTTLTEEHVIPWSARGPWK